MKKYKMFDPMRELAERRVAEDQAKKSGTEPSKVHSWMKSENYEMDNDEDEYSEMVQESKERRKRMKDLVKG